MIDFPRRVCYFPLDMRFSAAVFLFLAFLQLGFRGRAQTSAELLLGPALVMPNNLYYEEVMRRRGQDRAWERAKVDYLIERIRTSPYTFIRNGGSYSGREAAEHIAWKYRLKGDKVEDARDFIRYFATRSYETGKPYLVKIQNGETHPVSDLLYNELAYLDGQLAREE